MKLAIKTISTPILSYYQYTPASNKLHLETDTAIAMACILYNVMHFPRKFLLLPSSRKKLLKISNLIGVCYDDMTIGLWRWKFNLVDPITFYWICKLFFLLFAYNLRFGWCIFLSHVAWQWQMVMLCECSKDINLQTCMFERLSNMGKRIRLGCKFFIIPNSGCSSIVTSSCVNKTWLHGSM